MHRKNRIFEFVQEASSTFTAKEIEMGIGITTAEVAEKLDILRSNVSKDLNQLVREGKLKKLEGRPVRFVPIEKIRHRPLSGHVPSYKESEKKQKSVTEEALSYSVKGQQDIFQSIIGANGSMRNAVDQAKAAVLYPPRGLNTLITGPTGSGKSFFAHAMFQFAQSNKLIAEDKELTVFNCADYANNPELLMSYLFGYAKGAFTGAANEKEGLIQQADGSMLFLDEVHRLPPEGQEMIFYFMDTGKYSRLGETGKNREASIRIVCATTEDPKSTFLDTFMRRIPINIHMPSFKERPIREQLDLLKLLTGLEANRIQRKITMTEDVVKGLLSSVGYGNVGQLKSTIQLVCARGFMNQLNKDEITLSIKDMPDTIQNHLVGLSSNRHHQAELSSYLEAKMTVSPNEPFYKMEMDSYELPYNIYDIIGDKAALLEAEGLDQETIHQYISTDINVHLKSFYRNHGFSLHTESKLADVVNKEVISFAHDMVQLIGDELGGGFKQSFIYAISLHISSLLSKIASGEERKMHDRIREMAVEHEAELAVSASIKEKIASFFQVSIPENEIYYLTVLLVSLREDQESGQIKVVIAAHGNSTASSMAQVAEELLDAGSVSAVDMPLDMSPAIAYERVRQAVVESNQGSGVLLLVDMGSLATFGSSIEQETGIPVRSIDMVSTPMVLEAVRKASLVDTDLELLHDTLLKFSGYSTERARKKWPSSLKKAKPPVILAICASGEGTARKIKELIEKTLKQTRQGAIEVKTSSVAELDEKIAEWEKDYTIIATTGILDPKLSAPYIPLDKFIEGEPRVLFEEIIHGASMYSAQAVLDEESAKEITYDFLEEQYTFLNPKKVFTPLWNFVLDCARLRAAESADYAFHVNLMLHMGGLIERLVHGETVDSDPQTAFVLSEEDFRSFRRALANLEKSLAVNIPRKEYPYIYYYIDNTDGKIDSIDTLMEQ
ncbi:NtrC family Transcriptional regulator, ATPase domain protein [Alkalibacterium sp. AK22]|uniref:sigma-54-dependent transcriptional regulator n=1 Tax=Alkalibacterium sp. AK22 TaxID=1229520 RepID=UPI0004526AAC|nr:sigma 54-interacting transcriptional regulator [Alkalibacterium sp. AK22]EXJ23189.1 NtrC family Transcriptional regulator, ATPase domain protein [Alkalibacterium sp. AK22]